MWCRGATKESPGRWRRALVLALLLGLFTIIGGVPQSLALSWSIRCTPDPPPQGYVDKTYSIKFTLDTGGQKIELKYVSWESNPSNPVPGLSFSTMVGVDTVTLSGTPSSPGTYTFTLTVRYQKEKRAERTFSITILSQPTFNIFMIQLIPSTIDPTSRLVPQAIYKGREVLLVFYTDHKDPASISWRGISALPGTNFYVSDKNRILQNIPPDLYQAALNAMSSIGSNDRLLVLSGRPSASGIFNVAVEARDPQGGGKRAEFRVEVLEPACTLSITVEPQVTFWNISDYLFGRSHQLEPKNLVTTVRAVCPASTQRYLRGKLGVQGPEGFELRVPLSGGGTMPLTAYSFFISLDSSGIGWTEIPIFVDLTRMRHPLELAAPYPGVSYSFTVSLELEYFNESFTVNAAQFTLRIFYYAPSINVTNLKPITQYSNPYHTWDARRGRYIQVWNKVVMGKQATFRLSFDIDMPVGSYRRNEEFSFDLVFLLEFPKSEWEWRYIRVCDAEKCILPLSEGIPPYNVRYMYWFQETSHGYQLYAKASGDTGSINSFTILSSFIGQSWFWYPKPKVRTPSVFVKVVGIEIRGGEIIWDWDSRFRWKPFLNNLSVFRFEALATEERGFRLGYVTVGSFTDLDEILTYFPDGVKRYLEGLFPVKVKEVRFLGSRDVENNHARLFEFAHTLSEELAEANLHRAIVILPHSYREGPVIGWVYHDARNVAFVKHDYATDNGRYTYMPVVAHELSHTFGYPDIYYGRLYPQDFCWECQYYGRASTPGSNEACTGYPYMLGEAAFFDEIRGGLIRLIRSDHDIMACGGSIDHWSYHSWWRVYEGSASLDPPFGLLISLLVYRNGTVTGRPFSVVYNSSIPYPSNSGVGDFSLQLISRSGELLKSYPFNITFETYDTPADLNITGITAVVDWFDNLGEIRLVNSQGRILFSRKVSLNPPEVTVVYPFDGIRLKAGDNYTIVWRGSDPDGDELWFNVHLRRSGEESWGILAHRYRGSKLEIRVPSEPGSYELMVKVTDGVNTAFKIVKITVVEELPKYEVVVTSNVGVQISGSGLYEEGKNVTLLAPREVPMPGLLGILGARYEFQRWTGFVESENNMISFIVLRGVDVIKVTAIYRENTAPAFITIGILVSALLIATIIILKKLPRKN